MKVRFTYWQEADGTYFGYLNEFPDQWTQGKTLEDLKNPFAGFARLVLDFGVAFANI